MWQPIPRLYHGIADASFVPAVATAPETVGFTEEPIATTLCRAISAGTMISGLITKAEWGAVPVMPFKAHVALDLAIGVFSLAAPWAFGFAQNTKARNTFLAMGAVGLVVGLLTQVDEMDPEKERILRLKADALPAL
ncbi:SPW repeat protein [Rufibacter radiotolerans]|uniref:SPW repeat protein n=1 Tax=Rufibacter radiotolerans TaxID=1379910 RepID=UPI0006646D64|nr:SPW repeat protein [Rufibacter radiotolerans]